MSDPRLANYLISNGILSPDEWDLHAAEANKKDVPVLMHLVEGGHVSDVDGYKANAHARGWIYKPLKDVDIDNEVIDLLDAETARELRSIPIEATDDEITVATFNPADVDVEKEVRTKTRRRVRLVFTPIQQLDDAIAHYYSETAQAVKTGFAALEEVATVAETVDARDVVDDGVINKLLSNIIDGAISSGSSDLHIEPAEKDLSIRYGYGRKLVAQPSQHKSVSERLINLIKTNSRLQASGLTAQNGVLEHVYKNRRLDIRVAVLPAQWGESITLRVATETFRDLKNIGMTEHSLDLWMNGLEQPNGLILACGPMKSGKTTLHMSSIGHFLKDGTRKIVSLEDPVEVKLPSGITQVSVDPAKGRSWETLMETVLRSSAQILFLGEMNRDSIAHAALQAAGTGHLVLSTLHTNDAPSSVLRLREMGIRPSVLADSLRTVCAQRLPDKLCDACKVPTKPTDRLIRDFQLTPEDVNDVEWVGPKEGGCSKCRNSGFRGSVPIHEVMKFGEEIRDLVVESAPTRKLREAAIRQGMKTLQEDGLEKAKAGLTSLQELRSQLLID